jgi:inorganic pyrophosphatase/exopolyphosphatase
MTDIVMPYVDPDLDGVACAITLAALQPPLRAHLVGAIDLETSTVLRALVLPVPLPPPAWSKVERIWLVDTHHPRQLPPDLPFERVVAIIDHHPDGSPERFPAAEIQNEKVGAAATLVAERLLGRDTPIPMAIVGLLQAAILSNTLGLKAPATSPRDHRMFETLSGIAPLPDDLARAMVDARRARLQRDTAGIVGDDVKMFETAYGMIAVAQIEAGGALGLLKRSDLRDGVAALAESRDAVSAILNIVDLEQQCSAILCTDPVIVQLLAAGLDREPDSHGIIHLPRLAQRKTDIAPLLPRAG